MKQFYSTLLLAFFTCFSVTADEFQDIQNLLPEGSNTAFIITSPLAKQQGNTELLFSPASTQKLLTALTAKLFLPKDFTFNTDINGVIEHNSVKQTEFKFNADPTFSRLDLRALLVRLKQKGVTNILGNIQLNTSRFNGYNWSNGQVWNDQVVCYAAQASALIINGNCVLGNLKRNKKLKKADIYIPNYQPLIINSNVSVVTKSEKKQKFCALEVNKRFNNKYELFGCVTASSKPLPLSFAVTDPKAYFIALLKAELKTAGIKFDGKIISTNRQSNRPLLIRHQSGHIDDLLNTMLKKSNNLIADVLFKTIGAEYYQQPGNYRNGASAMKEILQKYNIDISKAAIADGSGLSRHNLLSATMLYKVLSYIVEHDNDLNLVKSMPISGIDGTLKYRKGLLSKQLKGNIQAKTGSLKGSSNLVGLVTTQNNNIVPFVLMINGYYFDRSQQIEPKRKSPMAQYLNAFFNIVVTKY